MQELGQQKTQLYCAVLTADSVSWFQLVNATTARKAVPSVVEGPAGKQSAAQDILVQHDSKRLNAAFTKVFCSVVTQLHIYGAKSDVPQSHGHPTSPPDRLFTAAISNAFKAVVDELCGSSIVLLASTADTGVLPATTVPQPQFPELQISKFGISVTTSGCT